MFDFWLIYRNWATMQVLEKTNMFELILVLNSSCMIVACTTRLGSVLMVCLLCGSHLIFHFALRQSQSMIPSLHSLLFLVVYPKVPYLAHSFSLSIQFLLARWSQKIPSNTICTLMRPMLYICISMTWYIIECNTTYMIEYYYKSLCIAR